MDALNGVDSNGVDQYVIDKLVEFLEGLEEEEEGDPAPSHLLHIGMTVGQRDAEYIVECVRVLLTTHQPLICLILDAGDISDVAIDVFGRFLRETTPPCRLHSLYLNNLPPLQVDRLLAALHTNRSVTQLGLCSLEGNEGAAWIADLLRQKTDFTHLTLGHCCFSFTQILPLLRGQSHLKALGFTDCRTGDNVALFSDPEFTELFVSNVLVSPCATVKAFFPTRCGLSLENGPLMAGFNQNTTILAIRNVGIDTFALRTEHAAINRFLAPIALRNQHLEHVKNMLGRTSSDASSRGEHAPTSTTTTTIPPSDGLWPTVLDKVGQGNHGTCPVYTILCNRLATWIHP
jgi:hypothetical protein